MLPVVVLGLRAKPSLGRISQRIFNILQCIESCDRECMAGTLSVGELTPSHRLCPVAYVHK